jgi:hypothetical protein
MGKPRPFLGQSIGPSTRGWFDGFEFGICLGFGIWDLGFLLNNLQSETRKVK